jgi:GNAT superfamily N-acetyltransferase
MIKQWDLADDAAVAGMYEVNVAVSIVDDPGAPIFTPRLFRGWLARGWDDEPREVWFMPGVGWYRLQLPEPENRDRAYLDLMVAPAARRRGHGSELLEHAIGRAAANGRSLVRGWAWEGSPGEAFALARGGSHDITDIRRVQDISTAPRGAAVESGYSLVTWTGRAPEEVLAGLAGLYSAMADAPHSEGNESRVWDAARVRAADDLQVVFGTREYSVAARHNASGELAALSQVGVDPEDPEWGYQEITAVIRAHRGHRLGLAVKSAMLDLLIPAEPRLRRIVTNNSETNKHMIAVNEALGYEVFGPPMKNYRISVKEP